jgi:hypothetical protein
LARVASGARIVERAGASVTVESPAPIGLEWPAASARVDGASWPALDRSTVWLPSGRHTVEPDSTPPPGRVLYLNADLRRAEVRDRTVRIEYYGSATCYALLDRKPNAVFVDESQQAAPPESAPTHWLVPLPRGGHTAEFRF